MSSNKEVQILSGGNPAEKRWELRKYRKDFLGSFCVEFREGMRRMTMMRKKMVIGSGCRCGRLLPNHSTHPNRLPSTHCTHSAALYCNILPCTKSNRLPDLTTPMMALPCISVAADEFQCDCALHCWVGSVHLRLSVSNGEGAAMEELLLMRARCRVDDDLTVGRIKATGCDEENSFKGV